MALVKAALVVEGGIATVPCYYNPEQLTISKRNTWESPQATGPVREVQFKRAEPASMTLKLIIDTTEEDVPATTYTSILLSLMDPNELIPGSNPASNNVRPPTVTFRWGTLSSYESVIENLDITFTLFSEEGSPLRADVSVTLKQYKEEALLTNPTSGTPHPHKVHRVQPGETLDRISARYYGDSTQWRRLAKANGLEDPLAITPGTVLSIPEIGVG